MSANQQILISRINTLQELTEEVATSREQINELQAEIIETQAEVARMAKQLDELHTDFDAITTYE